MKVYVAGDSIMHEYASMIMDYIDDKSEHEISLRWDKGAGDHYASAMKLTTKRAREIALECWKAIKKSDCFVITHNRKLGSGKWVELGMAICMKIPIVLYVEDVDQIDNSDVFLTPSYVCVAVGLENLIEVLDSIGRDEVWF